MRHQGTLTQWNDDRGFGFITPLDGRGRVFVHVSEFPRDKRRPIAMDQITYVVDEDERGRSRARHVRFVAPTGPARAAKLSTSFTVRLFSALVVLGLLCGVFLLSGFPMGSHQATETPSVSPPASSTGHEIAGDFRNQTSGIQVSAQGAADDTPSVSAPASSTDQEIARAFRNRTSDIQVSGQGVVERILSDDDDGSRHQRFILRLASGQTLLVAHNIDLAPRINALAPGDTVAFNGVYEWNSKGGVIHWTHKDPDGRHEPGWLRHNGATYQ